MLYTVSISEASRKVMEKHSKDLKVMQEQSRTIAGSLTKKTLPPPEIYAEFLEGVVRGKLCREYPGGKQ